MSNGKNSIQVNKLKANMVKSLNPQHMAVGIKLSQMQYITQLAADENAPHFTADQKPVKDKKAYRAVDGNYYYRPELRIAERIIPPPGPEVRFLKNAEGKFRLQFELEEAPPTGLPEGAECFNVKMNNIFLEWNENGIKKSHEFPQPTMVIADEDSEASSKFFIRAGSELSSGKVEEIYRAMTTRNSAPRLRVNMTFGYWLNGNSNSDSSSGGNSGLTLIPGYVYPLRKASLATGRPEENSDKDNSSEADKGRKVNKNLLNLKTLSSEIKVPATAYKMILNDKVKIRDILKKAKVRENKADFQTVSLVKKLSFYFDPELQQNKSIYSVLKGEEYLPEDWEDTGFGLVRKAGFPNTIYRLPDELRLAFSQDLGTPYMMPVLYRDDEDEIRVRVTLGAAPWHDPEKLVELQDYLYRTSAGALAAPRIVVGGYEKAVLKLTTAFPEEMQALGGSEIDISLERGVEVILDLSLEYYRFLCELVAGREGMSPVGLIGEVVVTLGEIKSPDNETEHKLIRRVPVRLNLDDMTLLPVEVEIDDEIVSPTKISIVNRSRVDLTVGDCIPRLLQYDENSVVPIGVIDASSPSTFPVNLAGDKNISIDIKPEEEREDLLWNAVQVELIQLRFNKTPREVLDRIHEIAPGGSLTWSITAECPLFLQETLPDKYQNLYRIEVQITRQGYAAKQLILGKENPAVEVKMERRLGDIIARDGYELNTFSYKTRNVYYDHMGEWSQEKAGEGSNLFIFPNQPGNN